MYDQLLGRGGEQVGHQTIYLCTSTSITSVSTVNFPVLTSLWIRISPRAVAGVRRPPEWARGGRDGLILG